MPHWTKAWASCSYPTLPGTNSSELADSAGKEHARHFGRKTDAQTWLDEVTASVVTGQYVDPKTARTTVEKWCATWLEGYKTRRPGTVKMARVHIKLINKEFGPLPLSAVRPSMVKAWTARMTTEGSAKSYVYAVYRRFAQIMGDAVQDGIIPRSPCSRKTSPGAGLQRPYVATTEQVWALHDAMPEHLRAAVLLGAFAGLRTSETCALRTSETCALRTSDVDFMRGVVSPAIQWPAESVKSETSRTPVPIPQALALQL
jgi:integrase